MRKGFVERDGQLYGQGEAGKDGPKFSRYWERLTFELREVRRLALNEAEDRFSAIEPAAAHPALHSRRTLLANAVFPDDYPARFYMFDMASSEVYAGRIKVDIHEAAKQHVMLWYWPQSEREDRQSPDRGLLYLSLHLLPEHMKWLWNELRERPAAQVELDVGAYVYQYDFERFLSETWHRQDYYLPRDGEGNVRTEGRLVGMRVRDPEPEIVSEMDQFGDIVETPKMDPTLAEPPTPSKFEQRISRLLTWTVGLLAVVAVLLLLKR